MPEFLYNAFTTKNKTIVRRLLNQVVITFDQREIAAKALWDTGATKSCISSSVVTKLRLTPTGKMSIHTPSGKTVVNTYLINVILPNNVRILDIPVCDSSIGNQGIDMLIGMDIITLGDFAVSNHNEETVFTFRIPSKQSTDYVQQLKFEKAIGPKHRKGKTKKR